MILSVLIPLQEEESEEKRRLTWSELVQRTGLSEPTLSKRLHDLESRRLVKRIVDMKSGKYPTPVYYEATEEAKDPELHRTMFFAKVASHSFHLALLESEKNPKEMLNEASRSLASSILFILFKDMEKLLATGSRPFPDQATRSMLREFDYSFVEKALAMYLLHFVREVDLPKPRKKKFKELIETFQSLYEEEVKALDAIWKDPTWVINPKTGERVRKLLRPEMTVLLDRGEEVAIRKEKA